MNQEMINTIIYQMNLHLDNYQLIKLKQVLEQVMNVNDDMEDDSIELLNGFIATKKLAGRSDKTLKYYKNTVDKMLQGIEKNVKAITTHDLRVYLTNYRSKSTARKQSVDNVRCNLSSFFYLA